MTRRREWVVRGLLAVGVPLCLLAMAEAALRMAGVGYRPDFWIPIPGRPALTTNEKFGWRFFPRRIARTPVPQLLAENKPAGTRRVFVLGESAAMGFPEPAFSVTRMLEVLLGDGWEVHNAAMTAINSHAILPIARDCARRSPDFFVVIAGNNEAIGPWGPATAFGRAGLPLPLIRFAIAAEEMRLGQVLARMTAREAASEWRGMEMLAQQQLAADDSRLAPMYANFRSNMTEIMRVGKSAGAKVVLVTVPVNLRDVPPFAGEAAIARYRKAEYAAARDLDTLRFRTDSRLNTITREVATSTGAVLADAEREFGVAGNDLFYEHVHFTPSGTDKLARIVVSAIGGGTDVTPEDVRRRLALTDWDEARMCAQAMSLAARAPFRAEHRRACNAAEPLAAAAVPQYEAAIRARPADLQLRMRYTELLREAARPQQAATEFAKLIDVLPGRKAFHAGRGAALADSGDFAGARAEYERALALDPEYEVAHFGLGIAYSRAGDQAAAIRAYQRAIEINPQYAEARNNLGLVLLAANRLGEAREQFAKAVEAQPSFSGAAYNLARVQAKLGDVNGAVATLRGVVEQRPNWAEAHAALGEAASARGDFVAALASCETALRLKPDYAEAHYNAGLLLARVGRLEEAVSRYKEAIRLRPGYAEAHNNLGTALARRGEYRQAATEFRTAVELQPNNPAARRNLELALRAVADKR
ncbi:MAG TPA: tetratricopeptide repeat protein [Bryobacteraceae bacterium]|nr:tetratricopeptide repeat protein [Bryobacteraceae bacterium]